jgi:hypothetical protein
MRETWAWMHERTCLVHSHPCMAGRQMTHDSSVVLPSSTEATEEESLKAHASIQLFFFVC